MNGIGEERAKSIIEGREKLPYTDFQDFIERIQVIDPNNFGKRTIAKLTRLKSQINF